MALDDELRQILVCPRCKGELEYSGVPSGVVSAAEPDDASTPAVQQGGRESLSCLSCRLRYAVEDDIPIMLIDEATPI
ncbi:MAG: Trm112 family protein [Gemmatimonadetes bacterium]|nr:Trm112 family protein [Gemmatimonadota bacterium]